MEANASVLYQHGILAETNVKMPNAIQIISALERLQFNFNFTVYIQKYKFLSAQNVHNVSKSAKQEKMLPC